MSKPNWPDLPNWIKCIAQDANGGWWGYELEPHQSAISRTWYARVAEGESHKSRAEHLFKGEPNPNWQLSLERRPA